MNTPTDTARSATDMAAMFAGRQPDPEMAAVLETMQEADPKPIETLDAEEARRQPTPADAVKKLLALRVTPPPESAK
jgi:hypothetical protein